MPEHATLELDDDELLDDRELDDDDELLDDRELDDDDEELVEERASLDEVDEVSSVEEWLALEVCDVELVSELDVISGPELVLDSLTLVAVPLVVVDEPRLELVFDDDTDELEATCDSDGALLEVSEPESGVDEQATERAASTGSDARA